MPTFAGRSSRLGWTRSSLGCGLGLSDALRILRRLAEDATLQSIGWHWRTGCRVHGGLLAELAYEALDDGSSSTRVRKLGLYVIPHLKRTEPRPETGRWLEVSRACFTQNDPRTARGRGSSRASVLCWSPVNSATSGRRLDLTWDGRAAWIVSISVAFRWIQWPRPKPSCTRPARGPRGPQTKP